RLRGRPGLRPPRLHRRRAGELQRQHGRRPAGDAAMTRTCQLLAILVACTASAFAIAQSQEAEMPADADAAQPQEEAPAPEAADPPVAEADDDYVDLRRARPITGNAAAGQEKSEVCVACHGP